MTKRMLVCGDRKWLRYYLEDGTFDAAKSMMVRAGSYRILNQIAREEDVSALIEGCADGADRMAEDWSRTTLASIMLRERLHFPAQWSKYGNAAGVMRNIQMRTEGLPDLVVAFHDNLAESKGTKHMVSLADKAGIEVLGFFASDALRLAHAYR